MALAAAAVLGVLAVVAGMLGHGGAAAALGAGMLISLLLAPWATH